MVYMYALTLISTLLSGLVKDLDLHRYDYANKHLTSHSVYILVEKQMILGEDDPAEDMFDHSTPLPPQYSFIPLLEEYKDLFPEYQLRVQHVERHKPSHKRRQVAKSPSPAGVKGVRGSRTSKSRTSSKKK